jgi:hypothetical protein
VKSYEHESSQTKGRVMNMKVPEKVESYSTLQIRVPPKMELFNSTN